MAWVFIILFMFMNWTKYIMFTNAHNLQGSVIL